MKFRHLVSPEEKRRTLSLYEASFPEDRGAYANYYYQWKCKDNEVLVLTAPEYNLEGESSGNFIPKRSEEKSAGEICAMLHLNPYRMWIATQSMTLHYIVAVATALPYRRQGCMRMLLEQAFLWMYHREEPFTYLMPANTVYYEPFGFRVIYDQIPVSLPMEVEKANQQIKEQFDVATLRDEDYLHFLKSEPKVEDMVEEKEENPDKNLEVDSAESPKESVEQENDTWKPQIMCRIIHVKRFLECLRATCPQVIDLSLKDPLIAANTGWYRWRIDEFVSQVQVLSEKEWECEAVQTVPRLTICIEELAQQLFGVVPPDPALSRIRILKRICINEEV